MHPLDNPVWHCLGGAHAAFSVNHPLARRYRREVTQIGAMSQPGAAGLEALGIVPLAVEQAVPGYLARYRARRRRDGK